MKKLKPKDYASRVLEKVRKDVPELSLASVSRIINIYTRNLRVLLYKRNTVIIDKWCKIYPYNKKKFKQIQKERYVE
jgi:hypothetical protein